VTGWLGPCGLALLALLDVTGAAAQERPAPPRRSTQPEAVDAEMLRDLDLLTSPDHARDREVARRMGLLERLRMLEIQRAQEAAGEPPREPAPAKVTR
jgi:hypothetical protein